MSDSTMKAVRGRGRFPAASQRPVCRSWQSTCPRRAERPFLPSFFRPPRAPPAWISPAPAIPAMECMRPWLMSSRQADRERPTAQRQAGTTAAECASSGHWRFERRSVGAGLCLPRIAEGRLRLICGEISLRIAISPIGEGAALPEVPSANPARIGCATWPSGRAGR